MLSKVILLKLADFFINIPQTPGLVSTQNGCVIDKQLNNLEQSAHMPAKIMFYLFYFWVCQLKCAQRTTWKTKHKQFTITITIQIISENKENIAFHYWPWWYENTLQWYNHQLHHVQCTRIDGKPPFNCQFHQLKRK